jgi:hypothetical protein
LDGDPGPGPLLGPLGDLPCVHSHGIGFSRLKDIWGHEPSRLLQLLKTQPPSCESTAESSEPSAEPSTVTQGSLSRYGTLAPIKTDERSWFSQMRTSSPVYWKHFNIWQHLWFYEGGLYPDVFGFQLLYKCIIQTSKSGGFWWIFSI